MATCPYTRSCRGGARGRSRGRWGGSGAGVAGEGAACSSRADWAEGSLARVSHCLSRAVCTRTAQRSSSPPMPPTVPTTPRGAAGLRLVRMGPVAPPPSPGRGSRARAAFLQEQPSSELSFLSPPPASRPGQLQGVAGRRGQRLPGGLCHRHVHQVREAEPGWVVLSRSSPRFALTWQRVNERAASSPGGNETETSARALSHSHSRFPVWSLPLPVALFLESLSRTLPLTLHGVAGSMVWLECGLFWTRILQRGALEAETGRKPCPVLGLH